MASENFNFIPLRFRSELMKWDVVLIHERFQIPPEFQLKISGLNDRVCRPPPCRMSLYEEYFSARLRLPLHPFFMALLQHLKMLSCSIIPNSWWHIVVSPQHACWRGLILASHFFSPSSASRGIQIHMSGGMYRCVGRKISTRWYRTLLSLSTARKSGSPSSSKCLVRIGGSSPWVNLKRLC